MPLSRLSSPRRSTTDIQPVLDDLLRHIDATAAPMAVFLIGSYLGGTADEFSDIDLVIVIADSLNPQDASFQIARDRPHRSIALDLMCMTQSEFNRMANVGGIAFEAKHHGRLLSGKSSEMLCKPIGGNP